MTVCNRRRILQSMAVGTLVGLAGCSGGDSTDDCPTIPTEPNYGDWFNGVSNYSATCDLRESDSVEIAVGAQGNDAYWAFSPAAVAITTDTTVNWNWTGRGGPHNVVSQTDVLDSGNAVEGGNHEFDFTFESPGLHRYVCEPHESQGMKGAVFVALE